MKREQRYQRIVGGEARGASATLARCGLALAEPFYTAAVRLRNASFNRRWRKIITLDRPVISIGNLTVGGTGKTPVAAWLCQQLHPRGHRPAVLMRGYKARPGHKGDEQQLLELLLAGKVPVEANPDRTAAASRVLAAHPSTDLFVLDDGFQHRRVTRDFDLVLIDATRPFGHGRLLPRGLLREPLASVRRASAILITRTSLATPTAVSQIRHTIAGITRAPVFESDFAGGGYSDAAGRTFAVIPGNRALPVCGIANPQAFGDDLRRQGLEAPRVLAFGDHHHYTAADVAQIVRVAAELGVPVVTTAKDWVKLGALWPRRATVIYIAHQQIVFAPGHEAMLLQQIEGALRHAAGAQRPSGREG